MKIGDIVCRKKYNKDIYFEIIDIQDEVYYLRGIEYRLIADSRRDDLELANLPKNDAEIEIPQDKSLKGTVLHIDGDPEYLKMCMKKYDEYGIIAYGYSFKEEEIKDHIISLLEKHKPNLLVITGHDALKKNGHRKNENDYLHSKDFVAAIKKRENMKPIKIRSLFLPVPVSLIMNCCWPVVLILPPVQPEKIYML